MIYVFRQNRLLKKQYDEKIESYLKILKHIEGEITAIKIKARSIEHFHKQANLIKTMPGMGDVAAYIILAETGDIKRFDSAAKLCSYAGITPSQSQTGDKDYRGRITKQG